MPRPRSIADAALPSATTEAQRGAGLQPFFSLSDAKAVLGMRLEQTDQDSYIVSLLGQAQAVLEKATGLEFNPSTGATAEFVLNCDAHALCVAESDVRSITSVIVYEEDGTATTIDAANYDIRESRGRTYIVKTDDEPFPASYDGGISVLITYDRGVQEGSRRADLIRSGMSYLVAGMYQGDGTATKAMRANPDFVRVVDVMKSQRYTL